ncbi:response regulator [Massilia sp. SYSU DXS3249]
MSMPPSLRILLVDDHDIVLWGLRQLIDGQRPAMEVAGTARSAEEALAAARSLQPDLIVLDMQVGNSDGAALVPELLALCPARIVILTGVRDQRRLDDAIMHGARGLVMKEAPPELLLRAIRSVSDGELWVDRATTGRILDRQLGRGAHAGSDQGKYDMLTPKEREVVGKVVEASGASNRELARMLFMSEHTLRNHLSSVYQKLGVDNRLKLYVDAVKCGFAKP